MGADEVAMEAREGGNADWDDTVATYCLAIGVQLGFQTFTPKAPKASGAATAWHPSTAFIATHTLTAALRDVASRLHITAAAELAPAKAALACAARELHRTIFQPYATWLKAVRLKWPTGRPVRQLPDADTLHTDLMDLALYWLVYTEAANLRHTPEMMWFIFFCAQRSWQVKQVVSHLLLHRDSLAALPHQPWINELGPGLQRAVIALHTQFRQATAPLAPQGTDAVGLTGEATLKLAFDGDGTKDADLRSSCATTVAQPHSDDTDRPYGDQLPGGKSLQITVLAEGSSSSSPPSPRSHLAASGAAAGGAGSSSGISGTTSSTSLSANPEAALNASAKLSDAMAASAAGRGGRRRMGLATDASAALPLRAPDAADTAATGFSTMSTAHGGSVANGVGARPNGGSAFAAPTAAVAAAAAAPLPPGQRYPTRQAHQPAYGITIMSSTPMAAVFDPRVAVYSYRELLLLLCPNEAAVDSSLSYSDDEDDCPGSPRPAVIQGSVFLTRVVQPLFLFMSEQIFELGQARRQGLESAVRVSYDDVTESMAHPDVVAAALKALPWATASTLSMGSGSDMAGPKKQHQHQHPPQLQHPHGLRQSQQERPAGGPGSPGVQIMPRAAARDEELYWSRLLALGDLTPSGHARIPWQGDMAHYRAQLLRLINGPPPPASAGSSKSISPAVGPAVKVELSRRQLMAAARGDEEAPNPTAEQAAQALAAALAVSPATGAELLSLRRANAAADWWARHVLRKTFVEHRSLAMPLIAFARVYQFQLVWFYVLCVWSWATDEAFMPWVASAAVLHWGSNCLLWTMQAFMATGSNMRRNGVRIPFYDTAKGRAVGPKAPSSTYGVLWWFLQLCLLVVCWALLAAGIYIAYIVWPNHDLYGVTCQDLLWSRSCYWWIAVVYFGALFLYELLYRQLNLGGYARSHLYEVILRNMPGSGTTSAASAASPLYDPAANLRTGLVYLLGNAVLWGATLGIKFVIDYFILVRPAGPRLRQILDTDKLGWRFSIGWGWWPEGWTRDFTVELDPYMAAVQVIVLFLLSLVSSGVAYSVAGAVWGALQGVRQGIGAVRHWAHMRAGFHGLQALMRSKLLTTEDVTGAPGGSWALRALSATFRVAGTVVLLPWSTLTGLLRWAGCLPPPQTDMPKSWEAREETLAVTAPFWNAIVKSLRGRDLLNDREAAALSFTAVSLSPASMMATWCRGGSSLGRTASMGPNSRTPRETYLPPVAVYVAQIPQMVMSSSCTAEQLEVCEEAYLYLMHLLVAVGAIPRSAATPDNAAKKPPGQDAQDPPGREDSSASDATTPAKMRAASAAAAAAYCPDLHKDNFHPDAFQGMPIRAMSHARLMARRELLGQVTGLVRALVDAGKAYKDTAATVAEAAGSKAAKAAASTRARAIDRLCMALHGTARCMTQMHDLPWSVAVIMNRVVVRQHFHQPPVKAHLDVGFSTLVAANRYNATAWGAEHMPSYEDFSKVASWLLAILRPTDEGTAPSNQEAVALLADFCAGLRNPDLPTPPRVEAMRAVTTLIPHYQETVMYAMSSTDARRVLEAGGAKGLEGSLAEDEVLFKSDDGAPSELLQYLLSEFPDEYRNLMERCRALVPLAKDEPPYTLEDFLPCGRLYEHRAQLLLWASFRGQVLARTVDGMCMYRLALAMQAVQDAMTNGGYISYRVPAARAAAEGGVAAARRDAAVGGRLRLSSVQKIMVRSILRDPTLSVEEMVAQIADVVPGLDALLERKYSLIVSSQVFSKMAESRSLADRWRAHGIALLATRYPSVRVAYLEADGEPLTLFKAADFAYRVVHQASVLVRAVPISREVEAARGERAELEDKAVSGVVTATDTASPSGMYVAPGSPLAAALAAGAGAWLGMGGVGMGGGTVFLTSGEHPDGGAGEEWDDGSTMLRQWRQRHLLVNLQAAEMEVLYRQQLPVNYYDTAAAGVGVILGEGKPENQNSAVIYCPGTLLQTIDMNQDNSLAQAFKLRNTSREFEPTGPPHPRQQQVAVLGYPEWIFSYRCGLLADLAAATERTFGTQVQRVMAFPSAVRSHYGHPDLWNRLFTMTRGGVSKANAVQHVSEDVFGGYNALKRGGLSKYVSYISVGKGRDMGLDSILGFEGKISKGCAEQLMSRDLRFLGAHMDFFRAMSLYHTVPGHFINTWLTVITIQLGVWVQLLLLLAGVGTSGGSIASAMGAVQILQLGTMPLIGFLFNLWMESGLGTALSTLARQFVAGGLLFHIFRSTTSAFHLGRAVLFGGASYVATGRGFSLRRKTFTQVFVNYGRSHLYLGADILLMVVLILVVGNNGGNALPIPAAAMWSPLLVAAALLAGPFWFTPFFFRLNQVIRDTREFRAWINGSHARGVSEGWSEWNAGQLATLRNDSNAQVPRYRFWSTLALVVPRFVISTLSAIVAVTGARFEAPPVPDLLWVLGGSVVAWVLLAVWSVSRRSYLSSGLAQRWRWTKGCVQVVAVAAVGFIVVVCVFVEKRGLRFSGFLITLYANYSVAALLMTIWVAWFPKTMVARALTNAAYRQADAALGTALSAVLIIICFIGEIGLIMVDKVQTLVQFNDRYSHTQAARPYAGEDHPSGGGGGGGMYGGGMALRRRLASPMLTRPSAGGAMTPVGPGVATRGSGPPSTAGGWMSPLNGNLYYNPHGPNGGSGASTPVFVPFAAPSTTAIPHTYSAASLTGGVSGRPPSASQLSVSGAGVKREGSSASTDVLVVEREQRQQHQQHPSGAVRSGSAAVPALASSLDLPPSRWTYAGTGTTASEANGTGNDGRLARGYSGAAAVAVPGEHEIVRVAPGPNAQHSVSSSGIVRNRMPSSDAWRQVASAAAERAVVHRYNQPAASNDASPQPSLSAQAPGANGSVGGQLRSSQQAWQPRPPPPAAASRDARNTSADTASSNDGGLQAASPWATEVAHGALRQQAAAAAAATEVSPMRSRRMPRPVTAKEVALPPIRPSPRRARTCSGSGGGGGGGSILDRSEGGGGGGGAGLAGGRRDGSLTGGGWANASVSSSTASFEAPPGAALTEGPLSGWVQPRAVAYGLQPRSSGSGAGPGRGY